ncbi:MAG: serine/threonine-protein phosphatase [Eubacterium sp.]|nr:serine/threonine-protein phosphatase [Eubacterium sp.]
MHNRNINGEQWNIATIKVNSDEMESYASRMIDGITSIKTGVSSIIGTREYQQDTVFSNVENGIAVGVVCDGMGGLEGGEIASQKAAITFAEDFYGWIAEEDFKEDKIISFLKEEAVKMDRAVSSLKNSSGDYLDAGTTVVVTTIFENRMYWMSVGDSRIYLMRNGNIHQITRDHNVKLLIDEEKKRGLISQEEYDKKARNAEGLISYLGIGNLELIDTNEGDKPVFLEENDIVILCSDGVYKRLTDQAIAEIIWCEEPDMKRAAKRLTDVVNQYTQKSQDNTSIVLMQYNKYIPQGGRV